MTSSRYPLEWIEVESIRAYRIIERQGIFVDFGILNGVIENLAVQCERAGQILAGHSGRPVNPRRAIDVQRVAESHGLHLPRDRDGYFRCDRTALVDIPELRPVLELRSLQHQLSTARGVRSRIHEGRVWPRYVFTPELGRPHCADAAYMAWPGCLHPIVRADPGCWFVTADFSAMELRVLATLSGDIVLDEALDQPDFHRSTAAVLFEKDPDEISVLEREAAKTVTYAILYGSSVRQVAARLGISPTEAAVFFGGWRRRFSRAIAMIQQIKRASIRNGVVRTFHGREWCLSTLLFEDPRRAERLAVSHVIQSTAGDLMRLGLIHLCPALNDLGGKVLGTVHDSYLMSVPRAIPIEHILQVIRHAAIEKSEATFRLGMKVTFGGFWGDREIEQPLGTSAE